MSFPGNTTVIDQDAKQSGIEDNSDDEASVNDLFAKRSRGHSPDEIDFLSCYYRKRAVYDHG